MSRRALPILLLATTGLLALVGAARADTNLNPFRAPRANLLDPLRRTAQAEPAPAPAAAPAAAPANQSCKRDTECPPGTICDNGVCRPIERAINVLLFRKEGPVTVFLPFVFNRRGVPGYRVIAPFYWHLWEADGKARVVAPFYWRFQNHVQRRYVTVVGLYSHTRQPDAESWALWPIFYRSTKFGWAAPLLGSFKIASPDEQRAFGLYAFLYFWRRSPAQRTDLLFPIFYSSRSDASAFTWALPLSFYWRGGDTRNFLALPLFFGRWNERSGLWVSPLGYISSAGESSSGSLLWLYWYGRRRDGGGHDVLFPLLWSFRGASSNTTVVGNYLHLRRGAWTFDTFFPLYWASRDGQKGAGWKLLFPLFFSRTRDHGRYHSWLSPLGGYRRDDDAGSKSLTFLVPPLIYRKDARREFESYLLLYWMYRDVERGVRTRLLGPFYTRDDPEGATRVGFPLFWYFRDARDGAVAHTLLPFYYRRRSPQESSLAAGVLPFWFYGRRFPDGWSGGLFPFAFFGRRADRAHAVVPPLVWHFRDDRGSATAAIPVFFRFTDRESGTTVVPPLLWVNGWERRQRYYVQIPFFWRFVDDEAGARTTVVPPVFYHVRRDGWAAGLAPLLFVGGGGQRRHFVLAPLFWHFGDDRRDRHTTVALNYLHRRHGAETTDALFPILYWRRGARPGGADESSFTLFPLVHYRRDAQRTVFLSPLAAWGRGPQRKAGFVLPYFWYASRDVAARGVPLLWLDFTALPTGERTRMFGPYVRLDGPGRSADILFPIFGRYRSPEDTGTYVFPTYFRRRTTDGYAVDTLFPLFWRSRWRDGGTLVLGPYFRRRTSDSHTYGVAPLFFRSVSSERRLTITPISYHRADLKEGTSRTFVLPLLFASSTKETSRSVVFPLWWAGRNKERRHRVFFPLYWHFANGREDWDFNLAGPVLWSHVGSRRTRGLLPVAWYSRDPEKRWGSNAVLPLFYEQHGPSHRMVLTLPFGFRSSPDRGWFYVGPFIWHETWKARFWTLFPLWFSHHDRVSDTHTRVVPPLLHYGRSGPDHSLQGWLLLFWHRRDITSSTTLGLPLFYDLHSFHERRLTMLLPLFLRYKSEVTQTSYTFAPLFYRRSAPTDGTTVLFPLFWDFRTSPERRTTVLFPLYAGFKRETWHGRYIFPNIWYRTGRGPAEGTSRLFVFPLWESAVKRPGDYMWEVLLGLFGYERIGRNRFLKVLFFPFEMDPLPPAAQTAWWGKRPPPRSPRARGVSTQAW